MRSPSRSASARRLSAITPTPSPSRVPLAPFWNGRMRLRDSAWIWQNWMYSCGGVCACTPPVSIRSQRPELSSSAACATAISDEAQAASTM